MANRQKIIQLRPEMADFHHHQQFGFRGDVMAYWANTRNDSMSVDESGFRHSMLGGKTYSVADCLRGERYGIVLGASNIFGTGVAGNENTMPSLLAERFGFPFANAAMPGGNSRNLQSLLVGLIAGAPKPPAIVAFSNGGDLANFCASSVADPIFGSPNRAQLKALRETMTVRPDAAVNLQRLQTFSALWMTAMATVCRAYGICLVIVHQSTFFEKSEPNAFEREAALGEASSHGEERLFANHRRYNAQFFATRKASADRLKLPLAGWGMTDQLSFLDEFHVDRDGTRVMSKAVGDQVELVLQREGSGPKKAK